jgi:hypothetical protein
MVHLYAFTKLKLVTSYSTVCSFFETRDQGLYSSNPRCACHVYERKILNADFLIGF